MDTTAYGSYNWRRVSPNGEFNVLISSLTVGHYQYIVERDILATRSLLLLLLLLYYTICQTSLSTL